MSAPYFHLPLEKLVGDSPYLDIVKEELAAPQQIGISLSSNAFLFAALAENACSVELVGLNSGFRVPFAEKWSW